jgi:hypothetical protein
MVSLRQLMYEDVQVWKVKANILTDDDINITDILNNIRAIRKITVVNNETTPEMDEKNKQRTDGKEIHRISIKFVSKSPRQEFDFFKKTMMRSKEGDSNRRIPGLLNFKVDPDSLTKEKY